jgi:hypothetical protein
MLISKIKFIDLKKVNEICKVIFLLFKKEIYLFLIFSFDNFKYFIDF